MKVVTSTDAKQRFGSIAESALREPVLVRKQNRDFVVIMSAEQYERIRKSNIAELDADHGPHRRPGRTHGE